MLGRYFETKSIYNLLSQKMRADAKSNNNNKPEKQQKTMTN